MAEKANTIGAATIYEGRELTEEFGQEKFTGLEGSGYNARREREGRWKQSTPDYEYDGEFKAGLKHGKGTIEYKNGLTYTGEWRNGLWHGKGELIETFFYKKFVTRYRGEFVNGKKEGKGFQELKNGMTYDGKFKDGLFEGEGILKDSVKYKYEGKFHKGKMEGQGKEDYSDNSSYSGEFRGGVRDGYGTFNSKDGYMYEGYWRYGVKQGIGFEFNNNVGLQASMSTKEKFIYEGEFWNNKRHGIGKYLDVNGDYYIGGWVEGKKQGLGFKSVRASETWTLSEYMPDRDPIRIDGNEKETPDFLSGYHLVIENIHGASEAQYIEREFPKKADSYYYLDPQKLSELNIDPTTVRFERLSEIYPEMYFNPISVERTIVAEFSKIFDPQLLPFLLALLRRPEDTVMVMSKYSLWTKSFFAFNMYFHMHGHIQKFLIAVDDFMPLTQEGNNLFCQLDIGENVILPMLEKVWSKYVRICGIAHHLQKGRYIDRIMLGFLGHTSIALSTANEDFWASFKKHWFKGCYAFCYLTESTTYSYKDMAFSIIDCSQDYGQECIVMQSCDNTSGPGPAISEEEEKRLPMRIKEQYRSEGKREEGYFIYSLEGFRKLFDGVHICTYHRDMPAYHCPLRLDPSGLLTNRFEEYYFSFECSANDEVRVSVMQDHIMNVNQDIEKNTVQLYDPINVPMRIVLGRMPISVDRTAKQIKQAFEDYYEDGKIKKEQQKDELMRATGKEIMNAVDFVTKRQDSLDSLLESIEEAQPEEKNKIASILNQQDNQNENLPQDENCIGELFTAMEKRYRNDIKYIGGCGQLAEKVVSLGSTIPIEQGKYVLMVQLQSTTEVVKVKTIGLQVTVESKSGNLHFEKSEKVPNFMERVFADLAIRRGEKADMAQVRTDKDKHKMRLYQYFSENENVYIQLFANKDPSNVWIQKIRPNLNNAEMLGVKNQMKPLLLRIEPNFEKTVIIQQVNAEAFHIVAGQGDFMMEPAKK